MNPHKLIKVWAEKEFRNLNRLMKIDLKVPEPLLVKENILIMSFIGENGIPAKRLRDMKFDLA